MNAYRDGTNECDDKRGQHLTSSILRPKYCRVLGIGSDKVAEIDEFTSTVIYWRPISNFTKDR